MMIIYKQRIVTIMHIYSILLNFRQLRVQQRVRLHICFFSSFIATAFIAILWDFIVVSDRVHSANGGSIIEQNTVSYTTIRSHL